MIALVVLIVLVVVFGLFVLIYNGLVRLKNQADNALSQIDVQLKRRHDLIPNLVEIAKRYLSHEQNTLTEVIKARNTASELQNTAHDVNDNEWVNQMATAENTLSKHLRAFNAVVENYPDLKGDSMLKQLMDELTNTENRIGFARQHYNDSVMAYNNQREVFPNNMISGFFNFNKLSQLQFEDKSAISVPPSVHL